MAAKDEAALYDVLADAVDFRALTPNRAWEAASAREVVGDILLGAWLEPSDRVDALEHVETGAVGGRERLTYRLRVTNGDGPHVVEQQAYYAAEAGRITWLRVLCSGFQKLS